MDPSAETYGFTKTFMSYQSGELVMYDGKPYLVKDIQLEPLKVILSKIEGGTKKVQPSSLSPVPGAEGVKFSSIDEIPDQLLRLYYPTLTTIIGSQGMNRRVILEGIDFSATGVRIKPMGEGAKKLARELATDHPEISLKTKFFNKEKIPLVVCKSKPSGKLGILKKYRDIIETAEISIMVFQSEEDCPEGFTANRKLCEKVSLDGCYFFQVEDLDEIPSLIKSTILGLARDPHPKKILKIPVW